MNEQQTFPRQVVTTIFYGFVAFLVFYTGYANVLREVNYSIAHHRAIDYAISIWFLISGSFILAAALLNLWHPRMAAWLALTGGLLACGRYALTLCGLVLTGFPQIFTPAGYTQFLLPAILVYMVIAYANWVRTTTEQVVNPFLWLGSGVARPRSRVIIVSALILSTATVGLNIRLNLMTTRTVTHQMKWSIDERSHDSRCQQVVILNFIEAPGYGIILCSDDLVQYLAATNNETVTVVFELTYALGLPNNYKVKQVSQWQGELFGRARSFFHCKGYVDGGCDPYYLGSRPGFPLDWK
ncbi:MAG: hypothetical protein KJ063_25605 [Anaerolineae bacterium]|nr:hypothetical protein [Anaerolineae bacterium]